MPIVLVAQEVGFKEGILNERLEDGRQEACLGEIQERSQT